MTFRHSCIALLALAASLSAKTVKVSDFKPDPKNATAALQAAFDSKADVVIVDNPGFEYLTTPLLLRPNQEVIFKDGVVLRALPGEYKELGDTMLTAIKADNLILRGEGKATLKMNKKDYQDLNRYRHSEWRHCITLRDCTNVTIRDLNIESSGGDGIYLGAPAAKNVLIENLILADHHRQGISVISAENVIIRKCKIFGTKGTNPMAGIDFEPNRNEEFIVNNLVEDCDIYDNAGSGIDFALPFNSVRPVSITVKNCRIHDNAREFDFNCSGDKSGPLKGSVDIIGCQITATKGPAMIFFSPRENGTRISFKDTVFDTTKSPATPVSFSTRYADDVTGIDFGNTILICDSSKEIVNVKALGIAAFKAPKGQLIIRDKGQDKPFDFDAIAAAYKGMPQFRNFKIANLDLKGLVPATDKGDATNSIQARNQAEYVQYAVPGRPVKLSFKVGWAAQPGGSYRMQVISPEGKLIDQTELQCPEATYELKAKTPGVHRIKLNTAGRGLHVTSDAPGFGYCADGEGFHSFRSNHAFYFEVPADLTKVLIEICTDPGEGMCAEVSDENGKVLLTTEYFESLRYLTIDRKPTAKPVLWRFRQFKVVEDNVIRLGAPITPIVYTSPENYLKRAAK